MRGGTVGGVQTCALPVGGAGRRAAVWVVSRALFARLGGSQGGVGVGACGSDALMGLGPRGCAGAARSGRARRPGPQGPGGGVRGAPLGPPQVGRAWACVGVCDCVFSILSHTHIFL